MSWPSLADHVRVGTLAGRTVLADLGRALVVELNPMGGAVVTCRHLFDSRSDASRALRHLYPDTSLRRIDEGLSSLERQLDGSFSSAPSSAALVLPVRHARQPPSPATMDHRRIDALGSGVSLLTDRRLAPAVELATAGLPEIATQQDELAIWAEDDLIVVTRNGGTACESEDLAHAIAVLVSELTAIAATSPVEAHGEILLHASAVVLNDQAWILCGHSGHGKSSTAAQLAIDGAAYMTDELVAVDPTTGVARGLLRPIGLEADMVRRFPQLLESGLGPAVYGRWTIPIGSFLRVADAAADARLAELHFTAEGSPTAAMLSATASVVALSSHLLHPYAIDDDLFAAVCRLVERQPIVSLWHGGPASAGAILRELATA